MKKFFNFIIFISTFILGICSVFAINPTSDIKLIESGENYLNISWSPVDGASGYYVFYSENTGVGKGYEENLQDPVEGTTTKITNLKKGTDYYISIISLDSNGVGSVFSKEVVFKTKGIVNNNFGISKIDVKKSNKIEVEFTSKLDNSSGSVRELKLTEKDNEEELIMKNIILKNENTLEIELEKDLNISTEYKLIVIEIKDTKGNIIKLGVNGEMLFRTPSVFPTENITSEQSVEKIEPEIISNEDKNEEKLASGKDTYDINSSTTEMNSASNEKIKVLPTTGPEHLFILILAFIIGYILYIFRKRKA